MAVAVFAAAVLLPRLCHVDILWAEETLPMAAAAQMLRGSTLYRGAWFDKPPLLPSVYLLWGDRAGWLLRVAGGLYGLLACWLAWRFASEMWGRREGLWAACLLGFYLTFDVPSAAIPLASDLLMLAPHIAAVWLAWRKRPFWSGALAGVAFLLNPKGLIILASCMIWDPRGIPLMGLGFAAPNAIALACLWGAGALADYIRQVWTWGRIYAADTFVREPLRNGVLRSLNWMGFHAPPIVAAIWFWLREKKPERWRWAAWAAVSMIAVAAGLRFFPRYFFQILPVAALAGARGLATMEPRRAAALALLLIVPLARFGPRYAMLARDLATGRPHQWVDIAMDQDSRAAAREVRGRARAGDTLLVWGFRPEQLVYTELRAGTRFLDSQPLTGVPADRHLTQSEPSTSEFVRENRMELVRSRPTWVLDGLGPYNPRLAIGAFGDLRPWLEQYREVARTSGTVIYRLR